MDIRADFLEMATRFGNVLLDAIIVRDDLHLSPETVRPGVAVRIRQGIRRVEAYLKRLILLMALKLEHELPADVERPRYMRPNAKSAKSRGFSVFCAEFDRNQTLGFTWTWTTPGPWRIRGARVPTFELFAKLDRLRALLANPEARAKRLAWHLARKRPGWLKAPTSAMTIAGRFGTEASAIFASMKTLAQSASLARPDPRGPAPRPPPRIRAL